MALTHEDVPADFDPEWQQVLSGFEARFGKKPELEAMLFLIGINELGQLQHNFSKEQKQDLMHVAVCTLLSYEGYYTFAGRDADGWPQWQVSKALPELPNAEQELLIKKNIIHYFKIHQII
ncbi:MAG: hypothetical protein R2794_06520 [Chitinophagales bacterium]